MTRVRTLEHKHEFERKNENEKPEVVGRSDDSATKTGNKSFSIESSWFDQAAQ